MVLQCKKGVPTPFLVIYAGTFLCLLASMVRKYPTFQFFVEITMNAKKYFQLILLVALVVTSLATASTASAASACGTSYNVISGDTLRKIATKCDTTVYALRRANPEIGSGDLIYPGQALLLPGALVYGNNGFNTYIIARGDTLKTLAARFSTSTDYLVSLNPDITNINVIYEGQRLIVPAAGGNPTPPPISSHMYIIQKGDTLKKIATWTNTTVDAILQLNPQITNPNLIYVGQIINMPASVNTYIVQRSDTLKRIAAKFSTTLDSLLAYNPNITNADKIYVGQVIRLW
jgi:peptidoglycan endopeptidase LytE